MLLSYKYIHLTTSICSVFGALLSLGSFFYSQISGLFNQLPQCSFIRVLILLPQGTRVVLLTPPLSKLHFISFAGVLKKNQPFAVMGEAEVFQ